MMKIVCGQCHAHFEVESMDGARCPQCNASAGLELQLPSQFPIQAFGFLLLVCVGLALTAFALALLS